MKILGWFFRRNRDFDSIERHQQMLDALNPQDSPSVRNNPDTAPNAGPQEVSNARNKGW